MCACVCVCACLTQSSLSFRAQETQTMYVQVILTKASRTMGWGGGGGGILLDPRNWCQGCANQSTSQQQIWEGDVSSPQLDQEWGQEKFVIPPCLLANTWLNSSYWDRVQFHEITHILRILEGRQSGHSLESIIVGLWVILILLFYLKNNLHIIFL